LTHGKDKAHPYQEAEIFFGASQRAVAQKIFKGKGVLILNDVAEKKSKGVLFQMSIEFSLESFGCRQKNAPLLCSRITAKATPGKRADNSLFFFL
jgi:hypothetical protein